MSERKGLVTFMGNPLTLIGNEAKVGETAPDFVVLDNNLSPVKLSSFQGKVCILSSVPSLDTPVCDMETRRFNEEAGRLGKDIAILTISMDLPFAQKRWCAAAGVDHVQTLSDHREASFGNSFRGSDQRAQIACKSGLPHRPKGSDPVCSARERGLNGARLRGGIQRTKKTAIKGGKDEEKVNVIRFDGRFSLNRQFIHPRG